MNGWPNAALRHVATSIRDGTHGTYARTLEGVPLLSAKNIVGDGVAVGEEESLISYGDYRAIHRSGYLRPGDVLLTIVGSIGRAAIFDLPFPVAFQRSVASIRPGRNLDARYLARATQSKPFQHQLQERSKTSAQSGVYLGELGSITVPVPPHPTQKAIADFLDHKTAAIDALIEKKQKLLDLLAEKRAALINQAVTKGLDPNVPMKDSGIPWIGEIPAHWEVKRLALLTRLIQTGPFGSQLHAEAYIEGGVPVVNPTNLVPPRIEPDTRKTVDDATAQRLSRHCLETGDLVFARRGALGRCGLVSRDEAGWLCGTGSLIVRLDTDRVIPEFVAWLAQTTWVAEWLSLQSVGSTMDNLNTQILGRLPLPALVNP